MFQSNLYVVYPHIRGCIGVCFDCSFVGFDLSLSSTGDSGDSLTAESQGFPFIQSLSVRRALYRQVYFCVRSAS